MKDVMGLIYTGENDIHLGELTSVRAVAALPIGGRYRVIDFQLSSMAHTGIKRVGIITQKNYQSLMDHLGSGREWDLHGKVGLKSCQSICLREGVWQEVDIEAGAMALAELYFHLAAACPTLWGRVTIATYG